MERKGKIIKERYEATASSYDELYRAEQYEKYFIALKKYPPTGKVLDAGCGTGLLIEFMGVQGLLKDVDLFTCLDYSWNMLTRAKPRVERFCRAKCMRVYGNVQALPFRDNLFDIVYSFTVLDLVDSLSLSIAELRRVSRGPVVVSMLKTLPYKDRLIASGARLLGVSSKDVILEVSNVSL